jgi:hypothetical protein
MQYWRLPGLGFDSSYLDFLCPGVPMSAYKPVGDGCPLGCLPRRRAGGMGGTDKLAG